MFRHIPLPHGALIRLSSVPATTAMRLNSMTMWLYIFEFLIFKIHNFTTAHRITIADRAGSQVTRSFVIARCPRATGPTNRRVCRANFKHAASRPTLAVPDSSPAAHIQDAPPPQPLGGARLGAFESMRRAHPRATDRERPEEPRPRTHFSLT